MSVVLHHTWCIGDRAFYWKEIIDEELFFEDAPELLDPPLDRPPGYVPTRRLTKCREVRPPRRRGHCVVAVHRGACPFVDWTEPPPFAFL